MQNPETSSSGAKMFLSLFTVSPRGFVARASGPYSFHRRSTGREILEEKSPARQYWRHKVGLSNPDSGTVACLPVQRNSHPNALTGRQVARERNCYLRHTRDRGSQANKLHH